MLTLGTYYSAFKNTQLLVELDFTIPIEYDSEVGLSFGANYVLSNRFEIITDFYINIPQDNEDLNLGITVGFISTL